MRATRTAQVLLVLLLLAGCTPSKSVDQPVTPDREQVDLFEIPWGERAYHDQAWLIGSYSPVVELDSSTDYRIKLYVADDFDSIDGKQLIYFTNTEEIALEDIYLRLFPNLAGGDAEVTSVAVDDKPVEPVYEAQRSAVRVPLSDALQPGSSLEISLEFSSTIPRQMEGTYGLFGYFDGFLVLDTFYPMIPVFDEDGWQREATPPNGDPTYNDISFYLVEVHAPDELMLIGTGTEVDRVALDGEQIVTFASGPARDFYLAAAEDFEMIEERLDETIVRSYAPARFREHAELALKVGLDALRSFEQRFGNYPYPEMDLIATPMRALGIEYPGIMAMNLAMYDPNDRISGIPSAIMLESTVAHEVAHQWFYNLVGNDQIEQPWLDEALAQYGTYLYYLDTYGDQAAADYEQSWYARWDRTGLVDIPIGLPAGDYQGAEYSGIVYGRGPIFVAELGQELGQDQLDAFLQDYVRQHAWGIATAESFQLAAESACECQLDALFLSWVGSGE